MTLPKTAALGSLSEVVKSSREAADFHFKQIHSIQRFGDMVVRLVRKQSPALLPAIRYVIAPFNTAVNHETTLLNAESRAAEDLQDLAERYEVLLRQWSEYLDINKRMRDARDKIVRLRRELEDEERKGGSKQYKLKSDITLTIDAKKRAVEEGQAKLEQILAARQAYYAFSARRLKHAYANQGEALVTESKAIAAAFADMQGRINEVRENIDGILDGTYALPEVAGVGVATEGDDEEEDRAAGAPPSPREPEPVKEAAVPETPPPFDYAPTPYEPAPYGHDGAYDDSPFPPE
jgi:hypothetical protein